MITDVCHLVSIISLYKLLSSNSMVSREIREKHALMSFSKTHKFVLRTRAISYVFEKLTRACFSQIALETILLPMMSHLLLYVIMNKKFTQRMHLACQTEIL